MGILKLLELYELWSEQLCASARDWFAGGFYAEHTQDIIEVLVGGHIADFQMVASYWIWQLLFVIFGAIDDEVFNAINTECRSLCKLASFLAEPGAIPGVGDILISQAY